MFPNIRNRGVAVDNRGATTHNIKAGGSAKVIVFDVKLKTRSYSEKEIREYRG